MDERVTVPTMADVARAAGVSLSTVSHVINNTRKVNPETEQAVRLALEETGYTHDRVASSLVTGRTHTIGLAMSALSNPYFADVAHVIERELAAAGYTLLLADTHDNPDRELRAIRGLLGYRVDGLVLAPSADPANAIAEITRRNVPLVLIDRFADGDVDQIAVENVESTARLVEHLITQGHQRIAMVAGIAGLSTSEERVEGYRRALEAAGIPYDPRLVVRGDSENDRARDAVAELIAANALPTALVVGNNAMTLGVMRGLRDAGLRIPEDVALVAFDDFEWADLFHPRITAIAQPTHQMAEQAVTMLFERISKPSLGIRHVRLPGRFVHRDSCGCGSTAPRA